MQYVGIDIDYTDWHGCDTEWVWRFYAADCMESDENTICIVVVVAPVPSC